MSSLKKNSQLISRRATLKATATALLTAMAGAPVLAQAQTQTAGSNKVLIVYFSKTGNTRTIAQEIHRVIGGDIFEVRTAQPLSLIHI